MSRLASDVRGNTMAMVAAGIIPLAAAIGGGVDMSRAYLAKARLNQACDAAALAGRRAMTSEDIETAKPEALKFFNFNFPQGTMQTAAFVPEITRPDTGLIRVEAATTVPTSIMKIFGYTQIPISVSCDATQNFDNIDIVLVLDVTGSMSNSLSGEQKIVSLRKAVLALYDELASAQTQLEAQGLRLRYGIVPYSTTVNVGKLVYAKNSSYIASQWTYQSRTQTLTTTGPHSGNTSRNYCNSNGGSYNKSNGWCSNYYITTTNNVYGPKLIDTSAYKTGASVNAAPIVGGPNSYSTWNGCIEERQTVSTITASSSTSVNDIPSGAHDLDINLIPNSDSTRWGPQWNGVTYRPDSGNNPSAPCPTEARRLASMSRLQMQSYVNSLSPTGNTYHDIGMIWGARFISSGGIFGSDNPTSFNDRPVNRFIIYMTDGILEPNSTSTAAYGMETWDRRIVGGSYGTSVPDGNNTDLEDRHSIRFVMACNAAKSLGVSVWTIAFGLNATPELHACASNSDQVATSANSAELIAKFKEIGKNIGALRLAK